MIKHTVHVRCMRPKPTVIARRYLCFKPIIRSKPVFAGLDWDTLNTETYYIGKGIILFTMFYCSMNWLMYKQSREEWEKQNKKDD